MKNYVKPTFILAAATAGKPSSCLTTVDLDLISEILGDGYDVDKIFGQYEACDQKVAIDYYCKFTSVELGSEQGFLS